MSAAPKWPKKLAPLTEEQRRISDDFMNHWLETLASPGKVYGGGLFERFNHQYALRSARAGHTITLDVGAGRGEHIAFENLSNQQYYALEKRPSLAKFLQEKYPAVEVVTGDIQSRLQLEDASFDRIIAIHILEHLPDLPSALDEIHRLLRPGGLFSVVLPCEGGLAYTIARNISAKPIFEKRYNQSYDWFIKSEHINMPDEIISELARRFKISDQTYFPLAVPIAGVNLCIGLTLTRK